NTSCVFFFQAEDGIRDRNVTGVQTCALPIYYPAINNYGASFARGEYLLLLNNDTEIINEDCLEELLGYCMRGDVGAVGARMYYEIGRASCRERVWSTVETGTREEKNEKHRGR